MPVQIGTQDGKCYAKWGDHGHPYYYECGNKEARKTAQKKAQAQGIAAIISGYNFGKQKISFDYDGTLSTPKGKEMASQRKKAGDEIYIITARQESDDNKSLFNIASELGIPRDHIHFTNGKDKWEEVKRLGINTHFDNNQEQIDKINKNTKASGILWTD